MSRELCSGCLEVKTICFRNKDGAFCQWCRKKMRRKKETCASCGKSLYIAAKGMCHSCYNKSRMETCHKCGKNAVPKKRTDRGPLCRRCATMSRPSIICSVCSKSKKNCLVSGYRMICESCHANSKRKNCICTECKEKKRIYSSKMCFACFSKERWSATPCERCGSVPTLEGKCRTCRLKKKICSKCGVTAVMASKNMCHACYRKRRQTERCSSCGRESTPCFRNSDGSMICRACYRKHKQPKKTCSACGKTSILCSKGMCRKCWMKSPDMMAKRACRSTEGSISGRSWKKLMDSHSWRCFYCGSKLRRQNRSVDHIVPRSKGGNNALKNLVPCCRSCNSRKRNKDALFWATNVFGVKKKMILRILRAYR